MVLPGMAAKESAVELGRRVRAARHYRGLDQETAAEKMRVEPATLGRYEKGQIPEIKRSGLIERASEATELPHEFFSINFDDLPLMMRAWTQVSRLPRPEDLKRIVDETLKPDPPPR